MSTGGLHSQGQSAPSLSNWLEKGTGRDRLIADWSGRAFSAMLLRDGKRPEPCVFDINGSLWRFISSRFHVSEKDFAASGEAAIEKLAAVSAHLPETAAAALKDMQWLAAWDAESKSLSLPHRDPMGLFALLESSGGGNSEKAALEHFIGALFAFLMKPLFAFLHRNDVRREDLFAAVILPFSAGATGGRLVRSFFSETRFGGVTVLDDASALAMNFVMNVEDGETGKVLVLCGLDNALILRTVGFSLENSRLKIGIERSDAFPSLGTGSLVEALARSMEKRFGSLAALDRTRLDNAFFALGCGASSPRIDESGELRLTYGLLQELAGDGDLARWIGEASRSISDCVGNAHYGSVVTHNGLFSLPCLARAVLSGAGLLEPYRVRSVVAGGKASAGVLNMLRLKDGSPDLDPVVTHRLGISLGDGRGGVLPLVPAGLLPAEDGRPVVVVRHLSLDEGPDRKKGFDLSVLWGEHPMAALNPTLARLSFPPSSQALLNGTPVSLSFHLEGGKDGIRGAVGCVTGDGREARGPLLFP